MEERGKKKAGLAVILVLMVALLAGGTILYNNLSGAVETQALTQATDAPAVTVAPQPEDDAPAQEKPASLSI